jgi:hypothetical protein
MRHALALLTVLLGTVAAVQAEDQPLERVRMPDGYLLTAGPKRSEALTREVEALDAQLFAALFTKCDADKVATLVTDELEFYHDKWGFNPDDDFVEGIRNMCKRIESGEDFRSRRELVEGSLEVYPMRNYGALEIGVHRFFRVENGKPDALTETGRFAQLWQRGADGKLRLSRVISYDHVLAPGGEPVPPAAK